MKAYVWRYGLIASVIVVSLSLVGWTLMGSVFDYSTAEAFGYLTMLVSLSFVFFGVKAYRDHELGGTLSFGRALSVGTLIALIPSAAFFLYTVCFFFFAGDKFMEFFKEQASPEQMEQFQANLSLFMNPLFQGLIMFLTVFFIGFFIAVLSALILQRKATA